MRIVNKQHRQYVVGPTYFSRWLELRLSLARLRPRPRVLNLLAPSPQSAPDVMCTSFLLLLHYRLAPAGQVLLSS